MLAGGVAVQYHSTYYCTYSSMFMCTLVFQVPCESPGPQGTTGLVLEEYVQ